ncbi:MAG: hypothetical protein AAGA48_38700 [Myxococcota bacterium]
MIALLAMSLGTAEAQDDKAKVNSSVQEIIVYSDDFARWDKTRWYVVNELILPIPVAFARDFNWSFASYAFQMRAILSCEQASILSKKRIEVDCTIEDVGILASTQRRQKGEADRKLVAAVLEEVDSKMTGLKVQLQTDFKGGLQNIDIEGLKTSNVRQRAIQETLRQILLRVMSGFHLRIPDHAQRDGKYVEKTSALMQMPSTTASQGSSRLVHQVTVRKDGLQVVQSLGEGTTRITIPVPRFTNGRAGATTFSQSPVNQGSGTQVSGDIADVEEIEGPVLIGLNGGQEAGVEANYDLKASSVAIFERATGIMTERIWTVQGVPTASSGGGGNRLGNYQSVGRVQILGKDARPDVGPSLQVSAPRQNLEGLPPWKPLETF